MKTISGQELARLIEKKGWELRRVQGSHHIYARSDNPARISIPIHGNRPLKLGLLKHLMKIAGITESEL
ncbi:MAG: hypothetical protein DRI34_07035 [Deltaproteobacteria bacterium]|nr:MAG: hypothetical protein DRI34_07035 [Deltaproteobacteria bacterium]